MTPAIFSAGTGFINIGLSEADAEAVKHGACDVADSMVPVRGYSYLNGSPRYEPFFRYYFKVDGTEIGYFTYSIGTLLFHDKPRVWDAGLKAALMKDKFINVCPGPIPPDDGRLALDTPERRDQEKYFGEEQEPIEVNSPSAVPENEAPDEDLPVFFKPQAD
jgi:hypothetical protein